MSCCLQFNIDHGSHDLDDATTVVEEESQVEVDDMSSVDGVVDDQDGGWEQYAAEMCYTCGVTYGTYESYYACNCSDGD